MEKEKWKEVIVPLLSSYWLYGTLYIRIIPTVFLFALSLSIHMVGLSYHHYTLRLLFLGITNFSVLRIWQVLNLAFV